MSRNGISSDELWEAYSATAYRAETTAGRVVLRIGESSSLVDRLLSDHGARTWAFVTAWNPGSQPLTDDDNAVRHNRLLSEVEAAGFRSFPGEGVGDDGAWPPEQSLLIIGISRAEAVQLGKRFEQNAVVVGCMKESARLADCRDELQL